MTSDPNTHKVVLLISFFIKFQSFVSHKKQLKIRPIVSLGSLQGNPGLPGYPGTKGTAGEFGDSGLLGGRGICGPKGHPGPPGCRGLSCTSLTNWRTSGHEVLTAANEKCMSICALQVHLDLLVRRVLMVPQVKLDPKDLLVSQVCRKHRREISQQPLF